MTEYTARTVTEAIEAGLQALGLAQEDVEIEVLEEGRGGVFGLGTKPARVRLTPRQGQVAQETVVAAEMRAFAVPEEPATSGIVAAAVESSAVSTSTGAATPARLAGSDQAETPAMGNHTPVDTNSEESIELARDFLQRLLDRMDLQARVEAAIQPPSELDDEETYYLNIEGEDLGNLIGRRGETLDALQHLVRLVVNQRTHKWPHIEVDVEHYKQRRERSLMRLAVSTADRAVSEKRTLVLEAMPARERRIVHLALRGRTDVTTRSVGEDDSRKVTIIPT